MGGDKDWDLRPGEYGILRERNRGQNEGHLDAEVEVVLQNVREVVAEDVDAGPSAKQVSD